MQEKIENERNKELNEKIMKEEKKRIQLQKEMEEKRRIEEEKRRNEVGCPNPIWKYFPKTSYNGCSIVDGLKSIGANSTYDYRCLIAAKNGIDGYKGTPEQNTHMLNLLKNGRLIKPENQNKIFIYFPGTNYNGCSIVDGLKSIGAESSYNYRCSIAEKNRIGGYRGTPEQNTHMLNLLKSGRLLRP